MEEKLHTKWWIYLFGFIVLMLSVSWIITVVKGEYIITIDANEQAKEIIVLYNIEWVSTGIAFLAGMVFIWVYDRIF